MPENIYKLKFSGTVQQAISELVKRYHLELDLSADFYELVAEEDPELVIFHAAKKIVAMEKGTNMKNVVDLLKKNLKIDNTKAQELADDIKSNVASWIEIKKPEEEMENQKKEAFSRAKEELLKKIGISDSTPGPMPEEKPAPYKKAPDITDVEDNAENMEREGKNITTKEKESTPAELPAQPKKPDAYQEPIE